MATNKDFIVKNGVQATNLALSGNVTSGTWQGSVVTPTYGGTGVNNGTNTLTLTGASLTITLTGTTNVTFPTSGTVLTSANVGSFGVSSIAGTTNQITTSASTGAVTLSLPASVSTTSLTLSGLTANSFLYSGTGGLLSTTTAPTNGQILIGSTGNAPVAAAIATSGSGISVTNAAGSITLANTGVTSNVAGTGISVSGATGAVTIGNTGVVSIAGTTNQVTASASTGAVTLSLPQNINTTATPTFNQVTITNAPVAGTDTVNLTYLQSVVAGLEWKDAAAVATTANITLSGLQTIDGYTTIAGDRVLVKNQTTQTQNGIYVAASGTWSRSIDANTSSTLNNATLYVTNGTVNADTGWTQTVANPTIGTTNIVFAQFSGSGTYTAGTGLTLTGNTFSITNVGTANTYGSASTVPVFTTNAQGQVTAVTNTNIAIAGSAITSGVVGVGFGGTGLTTTPTNGQLDIGNNTGGFTRTTLTAGTGVSVTNASGSITIANTGILSIAGTTNQITASTTSGVTTLSLPSTLVAPGYVQVAGQLYLSAATGISAAGTTLGTATALTSQYNVVNTVAAGTGVSLPTPAFGGDIVVVVNRGANSLNVYPQNGTTVIDSAAAGAAVVLPAGATAEYSSSSTSQWYTVNPPDVAGTGVSITYGNGSVTIANTGVLSLTAGTGVSVSASTGAVTVTNTGVTSIIAGTGISVSGATGAVTITNTNSTTPLTATYVGYGNGSNVLTGTSDFTWTDSTQTLTLGTGTSGATIQAANTASGSPGGFTISGSFGSLGAGGSLTVIGGSSGIGSTGGPVTLIGGSGSTGGTASVAGGSGNATSTTTAGAGGNTVINGGGGGNASSTGTGGAGGQLQLIGGQGGTSGSGTAGAGGSIVFKVAPTGAVATVFTITNAGGFSFGTSATAYGTSGQVLLSNGNAAPQWGTVGNSGLTNSSLTIGSTSVSLGGTATTIAGLTSVSSTTFVGALTGNAATATSAATATNLAGGAAGSIPYQTAAGTTTMLPASTNGYVLTLASGVPTWAASTGGVTSITGTANQIAASASTGAVTLSLASNVVIPAPSSGTALTVNGYANQSAVTVNGSSTSGQSCGLYVFAGTTAVDNALLINNQANTRTYLVIHGDGSGSLGPNNTTNTLSWNSSGNYSISSPTSGTALSVSGTIYSSLYSSPTAAVGTTVLQASMNGGRTWTGYDLSLQPLLYEARFVNTAASTNQGLISSSTNGYWFGMGAGDTSTRGFSLFGTEEGTGTLYIKHHNSAGAWGRVVSSNATGNVIISAASSTTNATLTVSGPAGTTAASFYGSSTTSISYGVFIQAGTNTSDFALAVANSNNSEQFMKLYGDGSGQLGPNTTNTLSWNSTGNYVIGAPSSGYGLKVNGSNTGYGTALELIGNYTGAGYPTMIIADPNNTNGAAIQMYGNGSTATYLQNTAGVFHIINSPYTLSMMSLDQSGNATFAGSVTASSFQVSSDRTLKKNIKKIDDATAIINKIDGVRFNWKKDDTASAGLIAQQVNEVMPELVGENGSDGTMTVNYNGMIGVLVEALKQTNAELASLKAELAAMKVGK